ILSCDERKIVILTSFVLTFCDIRLTAPATPLRSSLPESSLLPVRLAYQQCFCGHCVPFLAELPRFENSQNVKMTVTNPAFLDMESLDLAFLKEGGLSGAL